MGRSRKGANQGLPPNLYVDKNTFRYRTPDGSKKSLGTDRKAAIEAAIALNIHFSSHLPSVQEIVAQQLSKRVKRRSLSDVIDEFEVLKRERSTSMRTLRGHQIRLNQYRRELGDLPAESVSVLSLNEFLDSHSQSFDSYRQHRILLRELFMFARSRGYCNENPADALMIARLARQKESKKRKRLTQEQYDELYALAPNWLKVAMEISRQTGMRREDVAKLKYSQIKNNCLTVIPGKNPNFEIRIAMGKKLQETIALSKNLIPTNCPYVCHKVNRQTAAVLGVRDHPGQVTPEQITREFNRITGLCPLTKKLSSGVRPTFHEIRALCSFLYKQKGRETESTQALLGHSDIEMTETYQAGHKREIIETWADL